MNYTIDELIGMINLSLIIANGRNDENVHIPKEAALEINVYLEELKTLLSPIEEA